MNFQGVATRSYKRFTRACLNKYYNFVNTRENDTHNKILLISWSQKRGI